MHDADWSDVLACTFYLEPGQALSGYAMRAGTTKSWGNATLSIYPSTVGADATSQWIRFTNVTLTKTADVPKGSECIEPGGALP
jgi:hypothetical protein